MPRSPQQLPRNLRRDQGTNNSRHDLFRRKDAGPSGRYSWCSSARDRTPSAIFANVYLSYLCGLMYTKLIHQAGSLSLVFELKTITQLCFKNLKKKRQLYAGRVRKIVFFLKQGLASLPALIASWNSVTATFERWVTPRFLFNFFFFARTAKELVVEYLIPYLW